MRKIIEGANAVVLLAMFIITITTVIFRVFLKIPTSWSEDLAQYSFIFLAFIGSAAIMQDESHIAITVMVDRASPAVRRIFRIVGRIVMLPFLAIFSLGAWDNVKFNWTVELPTIHWMKIGYMYLVLLVAGVLMTYYTLVNLYLDMTGKFQEKPSTGGAE